MIVGYLACLNEPIGTLSIELKKLGQFIPDFDTLIARNTLEEMICAEEYRTKSVLIKAVFSATINLSVWGRHQAAEGLGRYLGVHTVTEEDIQEMEGFLDEVE